MDKKKDNDEELSECMKMCGSCLYATGPEWNKTCTNPDSEYYYKNDPEVTLTSHSGCDEWERNSESWIEVRMVCPECGEVIKKRVNL